MKSLTENESPCCRHAPLASRVAALSHPARIEILLHLAGRDCCCCKDMVGHLSLAQSTVSQHLKVLVEAGLVRRTPDEQRSRYEVDRDALAHLSDGLSTLFSGCCRNGAPAARA